MNSRKWKPDVLTDWPRWRDDLVYRLRRQGMSGTQVGETLKEIDAHVRESGETPESAFGDPEAYAATRTVDPHPVGWTDPGTLAEIAGAALGGWLFAWSALLVGRDESLSLGLHPVIGMARSSSSS